MFSVPKLVYVHLSIITSSSFCGILNHQQTNIVVTPLFPPLSLPTITITP